MSKKIETNNREILLNSSLSERWMEIASQSSTEDEVFIFSPFITGNSIVKIFDACNSDNLFLVTYLKPDAYLNGSLDIEILNSLLSSGVKLFHLKGLHAKMMLSGTNITIGSQNFTEGGKYNIEASVITELSKKELEKTGLIITELLKKAVVIDAKMLEKFVIECEQIRDEFDKVKGLLEKIEIDVEEEINTSIDKKSECIEEIETTNLNFNQFFVPIPVRVIEKYYETDWAIESYYTINSTVTNEILNVFYKTGDSELKKLENQKRYLCLELNSYRLFWIRANKKQIGKFATGYKSATWRSPDAMSKVTVDLLNPYEQEDFSNIKVSFQTMKFGRVEIGMFFSGQTFKFMSCRNTAVDSPVPIIENLDQLPSDYKDDVLSKLPMHILGPFDFKSKNVGENPKRLFAENRVMSLGLQYFEGANILESGHFYILR